MSRFFDISKNILWKVLCASFAYLLGMMLLVVVVMFVGIHSPKFMLAFLAGAVFFRFTQVVIRHMRK